MMNREWPCLVWGTVKLGRTTQLRTPLHTLPTDAEAEQLVHQMMALGIHAFDTAPAYGCSELRLRSASDQHIAISTKVGESHEDGMSQFDFSAEGVKQSLTRSKERLQREQLELVYLHASDNDLEVLEHTEAWSTLLQAKDAGVISHLGLSGKSPAAARWALDHHADALMVPWNQQDQSHTEILDEAAAREVKIFVKKGLNSGQLSAAASLQWMLEDSRIHEVVVGSLNLEHMRENLEVAKTIRPNQC